MVEVHEKACEIAKKSKNKYYGRFKMAVAVLYAPLLPQLIKTTMICLCWTAFTISFSNCIYTLNLPLMSVYVHRCSGV